MHIERDGRGYRLHAEVVLARPIDEVFAFFSDAGNLNELTPSRLQFEIVSPQPIDMHEGALIDYRLKVHGLPLRWQSRITVWDPPSRFMDVQTRGPYQWWEHEHSFEPCDGGTIVRDDVRYRPKGGPLVHALFVRRDIERIFAYRVQRLAELFGDNSSA